MFLYLFVLNTKDENKLLDLHNSLPALITLVFTGAIADIKYHQFTIATIV